MKHMKEISDANEPRAVTYVETRPEPARVVAENADENEDGEVLDAELDNSFDNIEQEDLDAANEALEPYTVPE